MAILDTVKKVIPYIKEATGYVLCNISSQAVEMDDGTLLQDKIESMDSEIDGKANTSHTHTATQITGLTASRAMVSDGSGHPAVSNVTATELNCLDGATSNIQDQINTLNSNLIEATTPSGRSAVNLSKGSVFQGINYIEKIGNICFMGLGYVVPTNLSSWTNNTIGTIPDGYIPAYYPFASATSRNGSWYIVSSSPNGGISIQPMVSPIPSNNETIIIHMAWICKD